MYKAHYKLIEKPFQISTDPKFLWLGEKHREALAVLKYGLLNNQGFLLLTGDVGTGKTTLINAFVNSLDNDTIVANVVDPNLEKLEFLNFVAEAFKIKRRFKNKVDFLRYFRHYLHRFYEYNKRSLLILDESHKIPQVLLEEIRLLSNIERQDTKLINIFFVGQNEFNQTLMTRECRALRQRITMSHQIEPLTESETIDYIGYRLRVAGTNREIFDRRAIRKIYQFSGGYPRLINIICDHALLTGYAKGAKTITSAVIKECSKELALPGETRKNIVREARTGKERKNRRTLRIALYACVILMVILVGYHLNAMGYSDFTGNFKAYYYRVSSKLEGFAADFLTRKPSVRPPEEERLPARPAPEPEDRLDSQPSAEAVSSANQPVTAEAPGKEKDGEKGFTFSALKLIISFDYNTNEIALEAYESLDEVVPVLKQDSDIKVTITGYTDNLGSNDYNRRLSEFRANIVKSYLVGKGINAARIRAIGRGEENPLRPNTTSEGRDANRRVEIELAHKSW